MAFRAAGQDGQELVQAQDGEWSRPVRACGGPDDAEVGLNRAGRPFRCR